MNRKNDDELLEMGIPNFDDTEGLTSVILDSNTEPEVQMKAIKSEERNNIFRYIIGSITILIGTYVLYLGINGTIDFNLEMSLVSAEIVNCSPGVLIIMFGFLIIITTKNKIQIK